MRALDWLVDATPSELILLGLSLIAAGVGLSFVIGYWGVLLSVPGGWITGIGVAALWLK